MSETAPDRPVRRLGLRIDHIDCAFDPAGLEVVTILVDDQELLSRVGGQDYLGWDPAAILDPDLAPLLPVQPARRVGLYGQATFCHAEEGCIAAIIQDRGEHVVWKDLRKFWSEYRRPTTEQDPDPRRGEHTGIPDVVFDATQYRADIARVSEGSARHQSSGRYRSAAVAMRGTTRTTAARAWRPPGTPAHGPSAGAAWQRSAEGEQRGAG